MRLRWDFIIGALLLIILSIATIEYANSAEEELPTLLTTFGEYSPAYMTKRWNKLCKTVKGRVIVAIESRNSDAIYPCILPPCPEPRGWVYRTDGYCNDIR